MEKSRGYHRNKETVCFHFVKYEGKLFFVSKRMILWFDAGHS